jgi:hypothetical protein
MLLAASMPVLFCIAGMLPAMDWPSPDGTLIRNFGFNDRGRPLLGTVIETESPALAAERGEVIFSHSGGKSPGRLPSPLGAWTAVDHGDGLISIYGRHAHDTVPPRAVEQGSPVALPGVSGWSDRRGFYFVLYDRKERRWVNPSMIITPLPDTQPPEILSVQLVNSQGAAVSGSQVRTVRQGRYTVSVHAVDRLSGSPEHPLAPYRIICSINGTEAGSLNFETISVRDGVLMVQRNGLIPAQQAYAPFPAFEAGAVHLNRGQATLEILVQDMAGNSRRAVSRLFVE